MGNEKLVQPSYVPLDVIEGAELLHEAHKHILSANKLEAEAEALRRNLGREFTDDALALTGIESLSLDEFIQKYHSIILRLDQGSREARAFFEMMTIRDQLEPGVFIMNNGNRVSKIDDPSDIKPVLYFSDDYQYGVGYGVSTFNWEVSVVGAEEPEAVRGSTVIGRDRILKKLDEDSEWISERVYMASDIIAAYEAIGEVEIAGMLRGQAAKRIESHINDARSQRGGRSINIKHVELEILASAGQSTYQDIIDQIKIDAARGLSSELVASVVEHIVRHKKESMGDTAPATVLEIAQANVNFVQEGMDLMASEQSNN